MALKLGLSARQTQRIALTASMRQSLWLLQLPAVEVEAELRRQAEDNPLLLVDREGTFQPWMPDANQAARAESLESALIRQIAMMTLPPQVRAVTQALIIELNEQGLLDTTDQEIADTHGVDLSVARAAVAALQSCEPTGVGARDLAECLMLQLMEDGTPPDTARAICDNLNAIFEGNWKNAEQATGLTQDQLQRFADRIRSLRPYPIDEFTELAAPLIPEIHVTIGANGELVVSHLDAALPRVEVDEELASTLRAQASAATAIVRAVAFRNATLMQVARALIGHQAAYFVQGPEHMKPLTRAKLAEILGLHATTVGRAIAGKALEFRGQVIPLTTFLSAAVGADSPVAAFFVQRRIQSLIAGENPAQPLSDTQIVTLLTREGVDIARRTVAKYRQCMKLPSSFERKRHKARR